MIITVEQIEALRPYIGNIEELISVDDVDALLDAVVINNILGNNNEPDKEGKRIQGIYDDIAAQNHVYWD